jgi:hypothetical protein
VRLARRSCQAPQFAEPPAPDGRLPVRSTADSPQLRLTGQAQGHEKAPVAGLASRGGREPKQHPLQLLRSEWPAQAPLRLLLGALEELGPQALPQGVGHQGLAPALGSRDPSPANCRVLRIRAPTPEGRRNPTGTHTRQKLVCPTFNAIGL